MYPKNNNKECCDFSLKAFSEIETQTVSTKKAWKSKLYPTEKYFQLRIQNLLTKHGINFELNVKVGTTQHRCNFRFLNTLVECETNVYSNSFTELLGQTLINKLATKDRVAILLPDDVIPRAEHVCAARSIQVLVFTESQLTDALNRKKPTNPLRMRPPEAGGGFRGPS